MIINNLTADEIKFLRDLKHELNTQSSRMTANPRFYQIRDKRFVKDDENFSHFSLSLEGEEIGIYEADDKGFKKMKEFLLGWVLDKQEIQKRETLTNLKTLGEFEEREILEILECELVYGCYEYVYLNAFLTEKACKEHLKNNQHNYLEATDYLSHALRNPELNQLLEILSKIEIE